MTKLKSYIKGENIPYSIYPNSEPVIVYSDQWARDYYEALDYLESREFVDCEVVKWPTPRG